jgi:hypothetical protein
MNAIESIQALVKALEAGGYNAAPSTLVQGAALQIEDLSPVMENVTFDDSHIKLQKLLKVDSCKSTLAQFDRQLSYGQFGGSAQLEGNIGQEENGDYVRITVPMCFYSHTRRVTLVATMVATVDGKKADEREAANAAKKIAGDIEFDLFRGKADFSNGGVFDGNPLAIPGLPNILGLDAQVRQSDNQRNAHDLMFGEFGSNDSVVLPVGSTLAQDNVEDSATRSAMNMGNADKLVIDPKSLSAYNKITYAKERIVLAGSPTGSTGSELGQQWTSQGTVKIESSRFLSGKTGPAPARSGGPTAPASVTCSSTTVAGVVTPFNAGEKYNYFVTTGNEVGESVATAVASATSVVATGDELQLTINHPGSGTFRYFNVYRSLAGGSLASAKYIGRVIATAGASSTTFFDLGNKQPGFVTGYLIQGDTMAMKELAPYSRLKLAVTDLSTPEAHFRFCTLAVMQPRKNVLLDNITG